jgi:flagellar hook-length control protein FliK
VADESVGRSSLPMFDLTTLLDVNANWAPQHASDRGQGAGDAPPAGAYHDSLVKLLAENPVRSQPSAGQGLPESSPQMRMAGFEVAEDADSSLRPAAENDDGVATAAWAIQRVTTTGPIAAETPPAEIAYAPAGFQILLGELPPGPTFVAANADVELETLERVPPPRSLQEAFTQMFLQPGHTSATVPRENHGPPVVHDGRLEVAGNAQIASRLDAGPFRGDLGHDGPREASGWHRSFDTVRERAVWANESAEPNATQAARTAESQMASRLGGGEADELPEKMSASRPMPPSGDDRSTADARARAAQSAEAAAVEEQRAGNDRNPQTFGHWPALSARVPDSTVNATGAPVVAATLALDGQSAPHEGAPSITSGRPVTEQAAQPLAAAASDGLATVEPVRGMPAAPVGSSASDAARGEASSADVEASFASAKSLSVEPEVAALRPPESPSREAELNRFVDRLAASVRQANDSGSRLQIRLNPPELGSMQIEVSARDGVISARLDVHTAAAHRAVLDNLAELRDVLVHNGTTVERIDVHFNESTRREHDDDGSRREGSNERQSRDDRSSDQQQESGRRRSGDRPRDEASRGRPPADRASNLNELDIEI